MSGSAAGPAGGTGLPGSPGSPGNTGPSEHAGSAGGAGPAGSNSASRVADPCEGGLEAEQAKVASAGDWTQLTPTKLPRADDWSHQYGNAANTSSNNDERVKGGLSVLWYGDPGPGAMVNRHAGAVGPISVNGRLFIQGEETLMAYDSYNGQLLWEAENPGALRDGLKAAYEPGNMAATDDYLFMVAEDKCHQFDAATGETVRVFTVPGDRPAEERRHSPLHRQP